MPAMNVPTAMLLATIVIVAIAAWLFYQAGFTQPKAPGPSPTSYFIEQPSTTP